MSTRTAVQLLVSGIVQGVGYRAWAVRNACELGLLGFVRNLHDGRVELWAEGSVESIDQLESRCRVGPRSAQVTKLERIERSPKGHEVFQETGTAVDPD